MAMVEIEKQEYEGLLGMAVKLGIIRRLINDEDKDSKVGMIETKLLRQVIGMGALEHEGN
jgi:hypothetical protein